MATARTTIGVRRAGGRRSVRRRHAGYGLAFVLPALLMIGCFVLWPSLNAVWLSLNEWFLVGSPTFVGIENYTALPSDPRFVQSLIVTLKVALGIALPGALLALCLGLALTTVRRGRSFYQTVLYLPLVIPSVVAVILWGTMYVGDGVINDLLGVRIPWIADPVLALIAILMMMIWTHVGYYVILIFAGLQDVPDDILEAASLDGAGAWNKFVHITFPMLRPVMLFVVVLATTEALTMFTQPYLLTGGGPAGVTRTLSLYIYETAFVYMDVGKASAMAVVLLAIAAAFATAQFRFLRRRDG